MKPLLAIWTCSHFSSLLGAFSSLKQLSSLDLRYNRLTELSNQALKGLQQLRQLHLSANLIANLSARALPRNLRILYLDQNQLDKVPGTIRSSMTLSTLHLSGNHISRLTSLSFGRRLRSLEQLFLDNLHLKRISTLAFKRLHRLEVLSLRNNSLESLPSLESLKYLSILYLTGNKWQCDCKLIWLCTWQKKAIRRECSPVECSSPKALQGQLLMNTEASNYPIYDYRAHTCRASSPAVPQWDCFAYLNKAFWTCQLGNGLTPHPQQSSCSPLWWLLLPYGSFLRWSGRPQHFSFHRLCKTEMFRKAFLQTLEW